MCFPNIQKCINSSLFNEFVCKLGFFWHEWASVKREWNERFKGPRVQKKAQFPHERVEYNVFLFDEPVKGSESLKIFKISLAFRFDNWICDIYQNPFTQEKILKFWHCRTKKETNLAKSAPILLNLRNYLSTCYVQLFKWKIRKQTREIKFCKANVFLS
jgi:hypothetical protein